MMQIATVPEILADYRAGRMVILVDDEDRENEGDIVLSADFVTSDAINFMARHARGLICLTLTEDRCQALSLPLMTPRNGARTGTNFTLSIEAAHGVTTGISAADRAQTIRVAVSADTRPEDLVQPGHVFPIMARRGGVLMRAGHTEAGCDLGLLAGLTPASVICEIMNEDGTMARMPDLLEFARVHQLKLGTIADLIEHRSAHESLVERVSTRTVQTAFGPFRMETWRDTTARQPHLALILGDVGREDVLVRVHEPLSCLDLIDAGQQGHAWSVQAAMQAIQDHGHGVLLMLNCAPEAELIFEQAMRAHTDAGSAGSGGKPDLRTYGIGAQILRELGVRRMRLLARPRRMPSMTGYGLEVLDFLAPKNG